MSIGGSLSGISFSGIGSGIDSNSIVQQLMSIERIPVRRMQANQARIQARLEIYGQLSSKVNSLRTAASGLNSASSLSPVTGTVADAAIASVSVGANANIGSFALTVKKLAQSHKVVSTTQTSSDQALNMTGDVIVNGKSFSVASTDTLANIASKINSAGAGVTASIIGTSGSSFLTLTSNESGLANRIQLADASGSVMSSLGLIGGSATLRDPITDGFRSSGFSSDTKILSDLTGFHKSGSFSIGGQTINVNTDTDTLSSVAASINSALSGQGITATIVDAKDGSKSVKKIELTGLGSNAIVDTDGLLEDLGVMQKAFTTEAVQARDASYTIDGITRSNYSNSVTDAISDVTITLIKDETAGAATTTINLNRDNAKVKTAFKSYMSAFNDLVDFVKSNSSFDDKTFDSGPLFGDLAASQTISTVQDAIFQQVPGGGTISNLTDLGFGLDSDGKLTLDEGKIDAAIATNMDSVKKIMLSSGSSTNTDIKFLGTTARTSTPVNGNFSVSITQLATKARTTAGIAQTVANRGGEILTFGGSNFTTPVTINIATGASLTDTVNQINNDSKLKDKVLASVDSNGKLKIEAVRYGSATDFTVSSNYGEDADTTGIGTTPTDFLKGVDVAGLLDGEPAVGSGQYLTGKDDNARTSGLQIQYTGTATGDVGFVSYSRGLSNRMLGSLDSITDLEHGLLSSRTKEMQNTVKDMDLRISDYNDQLSLREQSLKAKFLAMERAIAQFQSQQAQLSQTKLGSS